mmetsp:Transcript_18747/g.45203  ORF Transcript_18747/g.45203 Transcript_18747/m.45203 type:complete len:316 (+) Transcript_18747:88-1035(+)
MGSRAPFSWKFDNYDAVATVMDVPNISGTSRKHRVDIVGVAAIMILPCIFFTSLFWMMSMRFHFSYPLAAWALCAGGIGICLWLWAVSRAHTRGWWFSYLSFAFAVAFIAAVIGGDLNFWYNAQPYYVVSNLNSYVNIDPSALVDGQQYMDAGRVYFTKDARVDAGKAMGFKNGDLYCVAPIVVSNKPLASYDFWAVGKNCCSGLAPDFRCGEFRNPSAKSGLRLMADKDRPLYRLAVMKAASAYDIVAAHPLFFHWVEDPVVEISTYIQEAWKWLVVGIILHFVFNFVAAAAAVLYYLRHPVQFTKPADDDDYM